jgi:hypothetical protein
MIVTGWRVGVAGVPILGLVMLTAMTSCTDGGGSHKVTTPPEPISTRAALPVACGLIPERSIGLMFADIPHRIVAVAPPPETVQRESFANAECKVVETTGNKDVLVDVTVTFGMDLVLLRSAAKQRAENVRYFPSDIGPGFAQVIPDVDLSGAHRKIASAGIQWGDYSIVVVINRDAKDRNLLRDAIALAQQVGSVLDLPRKPTSPYPKPSP